MATTAASPPPHHQTGYYHHAPSQQPQLPQQPHHQHHQSYPTSQAPSYDSYGQPHAQSFSLRTFSSTPRSRPDSPLSATSYTASSPSFPPPTSYGQPQQQPFHSPTPQSSSGYYSMSGTPPQHSTRPPLNTAVYSPHAAHRGQYMLNPLYPAYSHPSLHHTQQDRPHKCDQCPQSFSRNHDLKRHQRIHLAVKPFPCDNCDKSFSRKDALKVCGYHDHTISPIWSHVANGFGCSDIVLLKDAGRLRRQSRRPQQRQPLSSGRMQPGSRNKRSRRGCRRHRSICISFLSTQG